MATDETKSKERLLRFSVRFAEMNLGNLRPGDWMNLRQEFLELFMAGWGQAGFDPEPTGGFVPISPGMKNISESEFRELQRETKKLFIAAIQGQEGDPGDQFELSFQATISLVPPHKPVFMLGDSGSVFLALLMFVLSQTTKLRLGLCPEDGKLFYRVRRQIYCSRVCTQRATKREWRRKKTRKKAGRKK